MAERLEAARVKITRARHAVESDEGPSPVLGAVVNEFTKKADKAAASLDVRMPQLSLNRQATAPRWQRRRTRACRELPGTQS
jgi:hypothetical protein